MLYIYIYVHTSDTPYPTSLHMGRIISPCHHTPLVHTSDIPDPFTSHIGHTRSRQLIHKIYWIQLFHVSDISHPIGSHIGHIRFHWFTHRAYYIPQPQFTYEVSHKSEPTSSHIHIIRSHRSTSVVVDVRVGQILHGVSWSQRSQPTFRCNREYRIYCWQVTYTIYSSRLDRDLSHMCAETLEALQVPTYRRGSRFQVGCKAQVQVFTGLQVSARFRAEFSMFDLTTLDSTSAAYILYSDVTASPRGNAALSHTWYASTPLLTLIINTYRKLKKSTPWKNRAVDAFYDRGSTFPLFFSLNDGVP